MFEELIKKTYLIIDEYVYNIITINSNNIIFLLHF